MNTFYKFIQLLTVLAALFMTASCDSFIYEYEEDCTVYYRLKFRYDRNLKFADAFAHEVKSVRLFAFNEADELVWQRTEQGEALASGNYVMTLPLESGKYRLIAWCGLGDEESFSLPDAENPECSSEGLHCVLNAFAKPASGSSYDETGVACSDKDLQPLFHGMMDVELPTDDDGGEYFYEMSLTKNTNVFRVMLQHLSGEDVRPEDFEFSIEDDNGWLAHDNAMRCDAPVSYRPWALYAGEAGLRTADTRVQTSVSVAVAEMTMSRLFMRDWTKYRKPTLKIRRATDKKEIVSLPVIDYVLLLKGEHHKQMDSQEFLDRADEYNMAFFLDEDNRWISTVINVLSWRVVINNTDL